MLQQIFVLRLVLAGCSTPPEKAIVKQWKMVNIMGNGREQFLHFKAKAKEQDKEAKGRDMSSPKKASLIFRTKAAYCKAKAITA